MLGWAFAEVGKRKGFAVTDSEIAAVEIAEKLGEKERNIIGSLFKRIKIKGLPIEKLDYDPEITDGLFSRLCSDFSPRLWLLLDEMDDHYTDSRSNCLLGLMQAAKHLTQRHLNITLVQDSFFFESSGFLDDSCWRGFYIPGVLLSKL